MRGRRPVVGGLGLLVLLALPGARAGAGEAGIAGLEPPPPDAPTGREIARRAEDVLRSDTTYMAAGMTIESPRLPAPRVVRFQSWDDRPGRRSFIRILEPPKDAGTGFLKVHPNLWMYVPRVERTIRIPPSLMRESWMGSDFTNDDLVRESSTLDDYEHQLLGLDRSPEGGDGRPAWVVEYRPKEEAPVVWDRIVAWIDTERFTPLRQDYYEERGDVVRTMRFTDVRREAGRWFPHRWTVVPLDKEGHRTTIEVDEIHFDAELDPSVFSERNLERGLRR